MSSTTRRSLLVRALFALSFVALGGVVAHSVAPVIRDYQSQGVGGEGATGDPLEPPALPMSFSATTDREALIAELELDDVWSTTHPEYDGEVRVLVTSAPVEGLSPNYRAAFYYRAGDEFIRIGKGFGFGGYHPPELGRHPTLDVPAVVCVAEAIPERTYFFVHDGVDQTFQENGDTWILVDEAR